MADKPIDTTDQQAVTVAQIEAARRYIRGEDDAIAWAIQAAIDASPDRLASVSSASAETGCYQARFRDLITPEPVPATNQAGEVRVEEAASICNSERCLAVFGAPEWAELSDDGKQWVVALIKEAVVRLHKQEGKSHG